MSNEAHPTNLDGSTPAPSEPKLIPTALNAFRGLLWFGIIVLAIGGIQLIVSLAASGSTYGSERDLLVAAGFAAFTQWMGWAIPLFVGAGIVAGLGKREAGNPS